jgi:hypothetical protein
LSLSGILNKAFAVQQLVAVILVVTNIGQDFLLGLYMSPYYVEILTAILLGLLVSAVFALASLWRTRSLPVTYIQLLGGFGLWIAGILIAGLRPYLEAAFARDWLTMGIVVFSYSGAVGCYLLSWWGLRNLREVSKISHLTSPEFL